MQKRVIKYTDYDGVPREENHFFNISKPELIRLELEFQAGLEATINSFIANEDKQQIMHFFERLIFTAFGVRTPTGQFIKTDEALTIFKNSKAYEALFMELLTDTQKAINFFEAVMPSE